MKTKLCTKALIYESKNRCVSITSTQYFYKVCIDPPVDRLPIQPFLSPWSQNAPLVMLHLVLQFTISSASSPQRSLRAFVTDIPLLIGRAPRLSIVLFASLLTINMVWESIRARVAIWGISCGCAIKLLSWGCKV